MTPCGVVVFFHNGGYPPEVVAQYAKRNMTFIEIDTASLGTTLALCLPVFFLSFFPSFLLSLPLIVFSFPVV
jgi:hypothetical protein